MKMRRKANISLLVLAILFVTSLILKWTLNHPWWCEALLFIAEAGMVGALADWFAVSALFRHPLGMKWIPHTAIVPKNRDKLIDGVVYLVEEQLLNKEMIEQQLNKMKMSEILISFVDRKWDSKSSEQWIQSLLSKLVSSVQSEKLANGVATKLNEKIEGAPATSYIGKGLSYALEKQYDQFLIEKLIELAQERVQQPDVKPAIKALLEQEKDKALEKNGGGWLAKTLFSFAEAANAVNFDDAADVLYRDIVLLLVQLKNPQHELRVMLSEQLQSLAQQLQEADQDVTTVIEHWKQQLLQEITISPLLQQLIEYIQGQLSGVNDTQKVPYPQLQKWLTRLIRSYWEWFKSDIQSQQLVESKLKHFLSHLIEHEHAVIGKIVRSTLDTFSEERLVEFVEDKVDIDLQRIRVNGALIGAAIGAVLYLVLHGIYEPLLNYMGIIS